MNRPRLSPRHEAMLAEMGVDPWWALGRSRAAVAAAPAPPSRPVERASADVAVPAVAAPLPPDLAALDAQVRACERCGLCRQRRQAVPGVGDAAPDWLVVGEAPGEEEDRRGEPFVGRAGQLLDRMLAAMGLQRGQGVYITNVIKCRPPQNRNPEPQEVAQCLPYLRQQIALLRPRSVLAMGRFAAQALLAETGAFDTDALRQMPLGKLRGRVHPLPGPAGPVPLVVTYHPAYLLRTPADKAKAWADLCLALDAHERTPARPARPAGGSA